MAAETGEVRSRFSPIDRMVLDSAERQFPEISKECPEREGESCSLSGGACRLYLCPELFGESEGQIRQQGG